MVPTETLFIFPHDDGNRSSCRNFVFSFGILRFRTKSRVLITVFKLLVLLRTTYLYRDPHFVFPKTPSRSEARWAQKNNDLIPVSVELTSFIHEFPQRYKFNIGQDLFLLVMSTTFPSCLTLPSSSTTNKATLSLSLLLFYRFPPPSPSRPS